MAENKPQEPKELNFNATVKKIYNLLGVLETEYNVNVNLELKSEVLNLIEILESSHKVENLAESSKSRSDLISTIVLENYTKELNKCQRSKLLQIANKLKRLDDINRLIITNNPNSGEHIAKIFTIKNYIKIIESLCMSKDLPEMLVQSKQLINCVFDQEIESLLEKCDSDSKSSLHSSSHSVASTSILENETTSEGKTKAEAQENSETSIGKMEVFDILRESVLQNKILIQVSNAINICVKSKKLRYSTVHIEAERILLWTRQKRKALTNQLSKYDEQYMKHQSRNYRFSEIIIKNAVFNLKHVLEDLEKSSVEWFVVLIRYEETVLASKIVKVQRDGVLRIEEEIKFLNLQESLMVTLNIYHLPIIDNTEEVHKTLMNKIRQFFKKSEVITHNLEPLREPAFTLVGVCSFTVDDLHKTSLTQRSSNSNGRLNEAFTIKLASELSLTGTCSGFLKPCDEKESVLETSM